LQSLPGTESYIIGHKEAQRIFSEQLPALPLFLRLQIAATRPLVRGFLLDPTENSELWNIEAIDLER
jgi:peptide/nickel transport system substrate-binding protein